MITVRKVTSVLLLAAAWLAAAVPLALSKHPGTGDRSRPVELGIIDWKRDLDDAALEAKRTGKPILLLFQEVPG